MNTDPTSPEEDSQTTFLTLLTTHERRLEIYVHSLVSITADAEDILQLTKLQLWHIFDQYQPGTNFLAWARQVAFYQMLNYRRAEKARHLPLDEDLLSSLAAAVAQLSDDPDGRKDALETCLSRLPSDHRNLILLRYYEDMEIPALASRISSTVGAVYRSLSRIRMTLLSCIEKEIPSSPTPR